ncbi:MAG: DUF2267 domain-containing protein [Cytophagaceae bacterium]|nr:DUF2267 domain-containing protein [Cytophagaceae bacterium]
MEKVRTQTTILLQALARDIEKPQDLAFARLVLKSVIHGLRDNISLNSVIEMLTALPPYLKEIFIQGWKPSQNPSHDQGIDEILKRIHYYYTINYYTINSFPPGSPEKAVIHYKKVQKALKTLLSESDYLKIERFLPEVPDRVLISHPKAA